MFPPHCIVLVFDKCNNVNDISNTKDIHRKAKLEMPLKMALLRILSAFLVIYQSTFFFSSFSILLCLFLLTEMLDQFLVYRNFQCLLGVTLLAQVINSFIWFDLSKLRNMIITDSAEAGWDGLPTVSEAYKMKN